MTVSHEQDNCWLLSHTDTSHLKTRNYGTIKPLKTLGKDMQEFEPLDTKAHRVLSKKHLLAVTVFCVLGLVGLVVVAFQEISGGRDGDYMSMYHVDEIWWRNTVKMAFTNQFGGRSNQFKKSNS